MEESVGCCGFHLECQKGGKCVNSKILGKFAKCAVEDGVVDYPFPTLYKLRELGLIDMEHNHITQKGINYLNLNLTDPKIILLTCLIMGSTEHFARPQDIKKKLFAIKELLK